MRIGNAPLSHAVLLIYVPSILMSLGQGMLIPALPVLDDEFGVSSAVAIQALTAQLVGRTLSLMPSGAVVDRWGPKPLMIAGAVCATASGVVAALAPNFIVVLGTQFTWGVGMSAWMFGREFAAFDMVRPDQRGRQMSALMGIGSTGNALGPAIGGALTDLIGVRALFAVYAATSGIVLVISLAQRNTGVRRRSSARAFFSVKAVREIHPYFQLTYAVLFISTFSQMARSQITNSALPLYAQDEIGLSPTATGVIFSIIAVTTFLMIAPTGIISDRMGRKWAAAPAAVFSFVGFLIVPAVESFLMICLASVVIGVANGLAMGAMTIYTYDIVPDHVRGQLQAMRRSFGEFGAMLSPPVVGLLANAWGPGSAFWAVAPLHGLSALLLIGWARESLRKRLPPGAPTSEEIASGRGAHQ